MTDDTVELLLAPLCPGFIVECLSPIGLVGWASLNILAAAISTAFIHRLREGNFIRGIAIAFLGAAGALIGFWIGAQFPTGGDPHARFLVGWFESGSRGFVVGALSCGVLASAVTSQRHLQALAAYLSVATYFGATLLMPELYWESTYGSIVTLVIAGLGGG